MNENILVGSGKGGLAEDWVQEGLQRIKVHHLEKGKQALDDGNLEQSGAHLDQVIRAEAAKTGVPLPSYYEKFMPKPPKVSLPPEE